MPNVLTLDQQKQRAETFAALHQPGQPLVLPNAWDIGSARLIASEGAKAIATTSSGVSWSLGRPDGGGMTRDLAASVVAQIAAAVNLPVTADIETGYGETLDELSETIRAILVAGAVGINLENSGVEPLYRPEVMAERIATVRRVADEFGVPLFINARTDVYLSQVGEPESRLDNVVERGKVYAEAGASGLFVPGLLDPEPLKTIVDSVTLPVNVLLRGGTPPVRTFAEVGVARLSLGGALAQSVAALIQRATREVLTSGTTNEIADFAAYADLNAIMTGS